MDILPGLPRDQRNVIVARAYERFRDMPVDDHNTEFRDLIEGNLYVLTFRYTNGFTPSGPLQQRDISAMLGGGYAQEHILVSVVKVVKKRSEDLKEIQLEKPAIMSYRNGPTVPSDRFVLHRDGHVMFLDNDNAPQDWNHHKPSWEFTHFPVLPVVIEGLEEAPRSEAPAAVKRPRGG
jgi:hypothetical protein